MGSDYAMCRIEILVFDGLDELDVVAPRHFARRRGWLPRTCADAVAPTPCHPIGEA